jgi:hypothetical protein
VLSRQMDVVILLFLAANILHIIWDRLWSWVVVGFFLLSYIVVVWRGLIEEYDLLYVKYSFDEFATFFLFERVELNRSPKDSISKFLFFYCFLLIISFFKILLRIKRKYH